MSKKIPDTIAIDFETEGIEGRPDYPPVPVGFSIQWPKKKPKYFAWGHPTENNCTKAEAKAELKRAKKSGTFLLFQNAKFDVDVAQTHMGFGAFKWEAIHDTLYLIFLSDPHAPSFALKESAERILGEAPEERDELKEWIIENVPEAKRKPSSWGAYICLAPAKLVGKYANGDTSRTTKLFKHLYPQIVEQGMLEAYDRERKLMPVFLESERQGMLVDIKKLSKDIPMWEDQMALAEKWLSRKLKIKDPEFGFDQTAKLAEYLDKTGVVTDWVLTKTGQKSTAKDNMTIERFNDKTVFLVLAYRNKLRYLMSTFLNPWYEEASKNDGYIHPNWNQVRQAKGQDDTKGTRTGRPSCSKPNFLNITKSHEDRGDDYVHPTKVKGLEPLPLIRQYLLPDKGCVWLHRDYSQQELRILAHFEDDQLMGAYKDDPEMDVHQYIKDAIYELLGKEFDRVSVKATVFGRIYGQGLGSLAQKLRCSVEEVKEVRDAQNKALPGLPEMDKTIKQMGKDGDPIITWGGRVYYVEEPKYSERFRREMTFEYKLLNYLIQGSAADATKEALVRFHYSKKRKKSWRFLVTVYDEINICAPRAEKKEAMAFLKETMESIEIDVPLLTDGKEGKSWGNLKKTK